MIRIVIADDHAMMRAGLAHIVSCTDDIVVAGEAEQGSEVLHLVRTLPFDLLLTDFRMPGLSGIELIQRVHLERPSLPILVLSMHDEGQLVSRTLKAGASGYVVKHSEPRILLTAVRRLAAGEKFIDPSIVNELVFDSMMTGDQPHHVLSNREYQVLKLFVQGKTVTEMAQILNLSVKTVSTHKSNIKDKLCIQADADLYRYAIEHKL